MIASTWRYPADACKWLLSQIAAKGDLMRAEDGKLCREVCNIGVTIQEPLAGWPIPGSEWSSIAALDEYAEKEILSPVIPEGFRYSYGGRLFAYPCPGFDIDQISGAIDHLRECPTTRRAVAITWHPASDPDAGSVPCLQLVDFLIRSGRLNLTALFRSWDCQRAAPANMYGLGRLLQHVGGAVGCLMGSLTIVAASGHIYED